ncbi:MAG: hypothetical protein LIR50_20265 [Bacillota bacterium]|nr:hypothetical protein [Bacillota bacterium]
MIKNNISSIIYHIFIRILYPLSMFCIGFNSSLPRSEQERLSRGTLNNFKSWAIFFVIIMLYLIFGFFLKNYENKLKSFLSVSVISIIGLLLMSTGLLGIRRITDFYIYYFLLFSFDIPTIGITKRIAITDFRTLLFSIIFALLPSFIIWIGIETKRSIGKGINSITK